MKQGKKHTVIILLAVIIFISMAMSLYARAGGAGGSDSGGDGIGYLIYFIIRIIIELPYPMNLIVAGIVAVVGIAAYYYTRKKVREQTVFNQLPHGDGVKKARGYDDFIRGNPEFDEDKFRENVRTAFMEIQKGWQDQDISKVRRYISDGVYQRFNTQFTMMQLLQQTNILSDINILNVYIDRVEADGLYDIIHTAVHAAITDRFESRLDHSLDSGGKEEFVEYWSFIKKRGRPRVDMYHNNNCPNCGAPLPASMGETSRCQSCGTLTNSGEFDWVLSEITQADDYVSGSGKLAKSRDLNRKIRDLIDENEDFSVQQVEDMASNGYLQIITATAMGDPSIMRRFVSDSVFEKVNRRMTDGKLAYNRIFLNDVYLVGAGVSDSKHRLAIAVKSSYQRVKVDGETVSRIDPAMISSTEVVIMSRDIDAPAAKGSIYAHTCASCGAPVENSLTIKCSYCSSDLNSTSNDWVITELLSVPEYEEYSRENREYFGYRVSPSLAGKYMDVRDYAMNNVLVMIAVDGIMNEEEMAFARELAKQWGYNTEKIEPLFTMAASGNLVVRMPEDPKKQKKIFTLMEKAARADDTITPEEEALLQSLRERYRVGDAA